MTFHLSLLRHGEAAPSGPSGDASRPLTARGERALNDLARRLAREAWRPDRIFTSPLLRARQSARVLIAGLGLDPATMVLKALEPEHPPQTVFVALEALGALTGEILLVGHQPQMGRMVAHLTGEDRGLVPGEMVRVGFDGPVAPGAGRIIVILRPG